MVLEAQTESIELPVISYIRNKSVGIPTVSGDVSDDNFIEWDLASEESEEFRIIKNTFKGPGNIDKVFEWHSKNK